MRTISIIQIIILIILSLLILSDFSRLKSKILNFIININKKNRKKRN